MNNRFYFNTILIVIFFGASSLTSQQNYAAEQQNLACTICCETFFDGSHDSIVVPALKKNRTCDPTCEHYFHKTCLTEWQQSENKKFLDYYNAVRRLQIPANYQNREQFDKDTEKRKNLLHIIRERNRQVNSGDISCAKLTDKQIAALIKPTCPLCRKEFDTMQAIEPELLQAIIASKLSFEQEKIRKKQVERQALAHQRTKRAKKSLVSSTTVATIDATKGTNQKEHRLADRITAIATRAQDTGALDCGRHAAKNAYAFYCNTPSYFQEHPRIFAAGERREETVMREMRLDGDYRNLDSGEVKQLLDYYTLPHDAYSIITNMSQFRQLRLGSRTIGKINWDDVTPYGKSLSDVYTHLAQKGRRHIFLINTGHYKTDEHGNLIDENNELLSPEGAWFQARAVIGHWFVVQVCNKDGVLHYCISDSAGGSQINTVRDLQWLLENVPPRDKLFIQHFHELHININRAYNVLTDIDVRGTPAEKCTRAYDALSTAITRAQALSLLGHHAFVECFQEHLQICFEQLLQSEIHAEQAAALQQQFYAARHNIVQRIMKAMPGVIARLAVTAKNNLSSFLFWLID